MEHIKNPLENILSRLYKKKGIKSFGFIVFSGVFQDGHRQKMGSAIWEFLWCLDKITKEEKEGEMVWGVVLGGKPVTAKDIAKSLHSHPETIKANLRRLQRKGYVRLTRAPYGYVIWVRKSKKWAWKKRFGKGGDK